MLLTYVYSDNAFGRILEVAIGPSEDNTVHSCIAACAAQGFSAIGTEFGTECYCGNRLISGAVVADEATCGMGCAGNGTYVYILVLVQSLTLDR